MLQFSKNFGKKDFNLFFIYLFIYLCQAQKRS